jgi:hypothetical protein
MAPATLRVMPAPRRSPAKPRLLSGGNPQIAKADGDEPVRAYIEAMPDWKRDVGLQIDAAIERAVPGVARRVSIPSDARCPRPPSRRPSSPPP